MNQIARRALGAAGFALLLATSVSFAQQPPPVRVRGTVEAVDGPVLTVKSRDGHTTYKVKLTDNAAMRGTGEGHRPWDLAPNSTMTNATVSQIVKGVQGNEITLKYKEGEKKIVVAPETVIVTYVPGDKSELKPGAKIFIA